MLRLGLSILALCLGLAVLSASATTSMPPPSGLWLTANHQAVIQIGPCGQDMCGQIVGIALDHPGDPMPKDWLGQPQCGLTIIQTTPVTDASGTTVWKGVVLDPRNGAVHSARIAFDAFRNMLLRGYAFFPIFGETQTWTPYSGTPAPNCRLG